MVEIKTGFIICLFDVNNEDFASLQASLSVPGVRDRMLVMQHTLVIQYHSSSLVRQ